MDMVRSPKSIAGAVGLALGNAPYKIRDRTFIIKGARSRLQQELKQENKRTRSLGYENDPEQT